MNFIPRSLLLATLALGLTGAAVRATPLARQEIASAATWVAHLDLDRLRATAFGELLDAELANPESAAKLDAFAALVRFDPRRDLRGLTFYGVGNDKHDVITLARGAFDVGHLVTLVKANATYESQAHGQHTIHSWIDEKQQRAGGGGPRTHAAAHPAGVMVFAKTAALVARGLDTLDGRATNLVNTTAFAELDAARDAMFLLAGGNLGAIDNLDPQAAVFRQARYGSLLIGQRGADVELTLALDAKDTRTANQIEAVGRGLIALLSLRNDDAFAAALAERAQLGNDGARVTLSLVLPAGEFLRICREKAAAQQAPQ